MIRVAVIGLGIGQRHVRAYMENPKTEVVGVVDINPQRTQAVEDEYGLPTFRVLETLLDKVTVDAASICTPPALHAPQVEQLAIAGVHCLVEKPMASSTAECRRIINAADRSGIQVMVAQKKRFTPIYHHLKRMLDSSFGPVRWLCVKYALGRVDHAWFWDEQNGGGPILENAIHMWDMLHFLVGDVESIYAAGGNLFRPDHGDQLDTAAVSLRFTSGAIGSVACGYGSEWGFSDERFSIATTKACCEISGPFDRPSKMRYIYRDAPHNVHAPTFDHDATGFPEEISAFVEALDSGCITPVPPSDAARSVALAVAAKRSAREGRTLTKDEIYR